MAPNGASFDFGHDDVPWCNTDNLQLCRAGGEGFVPRGREVTHFSQWDKLSSEAFRRSQIRVKLFLCIGKLFLIFFSFFLSPVLMAPSEPSVVGVVTTQAPGA